MGTPRPGGRVGQPPLNYFSIKRNDTPQELSPGRGVALVFSFSLLDPGLVLLLGLLDCLFLRLDLIRLLCLHD